MSIPNGNKRNFETLKRAFKRHDVCLLECTDNKTGEKVDALCAVEWDGEQYEMKPFAIMLRENIYDRITPPK